MRPEDVLKELGYKLPEPPEPRGFYLPFLEIRGLVFISGLLPLKEGSLLHKGKVGRDLTLKEAEECAIQIVLNCLSILHSKIGLHRIDHCVRINGYLQTSEDFTEHPQVLNAASELVVKVFGDRGRHTRIAVGVASLPMNSPIEMDFIWSLKD